MDRKYRIRPSKPVSIRIDMYPSLPLGGKIQSVAACFGLIFKTGLAFALFPEAGASFLTAVLGIVFLMEGVLSILLGLRMSGQLNNWRWIIFRGICVFGLGLFILVQWPQSKHWVLGVLVGMNFLSNGISLFIASRDSAVVA